MRAAVVYDDASRKLVHALKYHDRLEAALLMARLMRRTAGDILTTQAVLVPVPLHPWRLWQRRYNQSGLLAKHLAILSGAENKPNLMVRQRATASQVGLGEAERQANLRGAFQVPEQYLGELSADTSCWSMTFLQPVPRLPRPASAFCPLEQRGWMFSFLQL